MNNLAEVSIWEKVIANSLKKKVLKNQRRPSLDRSHTVNTLNGRPRPALVRVTKKKIQLSPKLDKSTVSSQLGGFQHSVSLKQTFNSGYEVEVLPRVSKRCSYFTPRKREFLLSQRTSLRSHETYQGEFYSRCGASLHKFSSRK